MEDPQGQSEAGTVTDVMAKALNFFLNQVLAGTFTDGRYLCYETSKCWLTLQNRKPRTRDKEYAALVRALPHHGSPVDRKRAIYKTTQ